MGKKKITSIIIIIIIVIFQFIIISQIQKFNHSNNILLYEQTNVQLVENILSDKISKISENHNNICIQIFNLKYDQDLNISYIQQTSMSNIDKDLISDMKIYIVDKFYNPMNYSDIDNINFMEIKKQMREKNNNDTHDFVNINGDVYYQNIYTLYNKTLDVFAHQMFQTKIDDNFLNNISSQTGIFSIQLNIKNSNIIKSNNFDFNIISKSFVNNYYIENNILNISRVYNDKFDAMSEQSELIENNIILYIQDKNYVNNISLSYEKYTLMFIILITDFLIFIILYVFLSKELFVDKIKDDFDDITDLLEQTNTFDYDKISDILAKAENHNNLKNKFKDNTNESEYSKNILLDTVDMYTAILRKEDKQ